MDVIVFGAAASTHSCTCRDAGARPPLGLGLFSSLLAAQPEVRDVLDERALEAFTNKPFEEGMALALNSGSLSVSPLLRATAKYLSRFDLCGCRENGYRRMLLGLGAQLHRTRFATLNYDLLLDRAVLGLGLNLRLGGQPDRGTVSILKPHGAVNLLPVMNGRIEGCSFIRCSTYVETGNVVCPPPLEAKEITDWCDDARNSCMAPVMSVYAAGKQTPFNSSLVEEQRQIWAEQVRSAKRVVIIGVKLVEHDAHLWEPLGANRGALMYVNTSADDRDEFANWSRRERGHAPLECVQEKFLDAIPLILRRLAN